jgi:hypothetical protein
MEDIPNNVLDKDLYIDAKRIADETYKRHSAWKSMFIVRTYKKLGGEYSKAKNKEPTKDRTDLWRKEEWIQILPYLKNKDKLTCGKPKEIGTPNACRPTKNVKGGENNITIDEIIKKWGKAKVKKLTKQKLDDMDGRLNWKTGTFKASK